MDMKQKLTDYKNEISRWEKVTYRTDKVDPSRKKAVPGKKSMLYVNMTTLRKMLDARSISANRIAYLVMDECEFGTNLYHATYEEIGEILELSRGSVIKGMSELQTVDFIRKIKNGRWMLNPAVGTKCYADDIDKLHDIYATHAPYTPKKMKGEPCDENVG